MNILRWLKRLPTAISVLELFVMLASATCAHAASFTISGPDFTPRFLDADNETGVIKEDGTLTTGPTAITSMANFVTVLNNGAISTTGSAAFGIQLLNADFNIITNNGSINTMSISSIGIFLKGGNNNNTINNYSSISTKGLGATSILADGGSNNYGHVFATGGAGGYETAYGPFRVGFMAGYAYSEVITDIRSIDTDSDSYFVGAYGQIRFGWLNLDMALLGGYEQHDNDRLVVDNLFGFEVAQADFDSYFLSPSFTLEQRGQDFRKYCASTIRHRDI